jgi:hypothetical protein
MLQQFERNSVPNTHRQIGNAAKELPGRSELALSCGRRHWIAF